MSCTVTPDAVQLPKDAASVPAARRFVYARLKDHCPEDMTETALLLASELVTNAVRYGSEPIELDVCCTAEADAVKVTVSDANPAPPVLRPGLPDAPGGRGLHLLSALSESWGLAHHDAGKSVWFTLRLQPSPAG